MVRAMSIMYVRCVSVLGYMGVEVPRDTSPGIRWGACEQGHATARAPLDPRAGNAVTSTWRECRHDHLDTAPLNQLGQAVMHSARDLQTRLRIDLAIQIGSAIEPVPRAHAQVTADRRPGAGPGLL